MKRSNFKILKQIWQICSKSNFKRSRDLNSHRKRLKLHQKHLKHTRLKLTFTEMLE